eukprot:scpid66435/ scgid12004/ 
MMTQSTSSPNFSNTSFKASSSISLPAPPTNTFPRAPREPLPACGGGIALNYKHSVYKRTKTWKQQALTITFSTLNSKKRNYFLVAAKNNSVLLSFVHNFIPALVHVHAI